MILRALQKFNIPAPRTDTETFRMIRWGKNKRYWLKKFDGGYVFGDFVQGISEHCFDKVYKGEALKEMKIKMQKALIEADNEQELIHKNAAEKANTIWNEAKSTVDHPYLSTKKVQSYGLKSYQQCLLIPLFDVDDNLCSLQFIAKNANKRFLSGGKKNGCVYYRIT